MAKTAKKSSAKKSRGAQPRSKGEGQQDPPIIIKSGGILPKSSAAEDLNSMEMDCRLAMNQFVDSKDVAHPFKYSYSITTIPAITRMSIVIGDKSIFDGSVEKMNWAISMFTD